MQGKMLVTEAPKCKLQEAKNPARSSDAPVLRSMHRSQMPAFRVPDTLHCLHLDSTLPPAPFLPWAMGTSLVRDGGTGGPRAAGTGPGVALPAPRSSGRALSRLEAGGCSQVVTSLRRAKKAISSCS